MENDGFVLVRGHRGRRRGAGSTPARVTTSALPRRVEAHDSGSTESSDDATPTTDEPVHASTSQLGPARSDASRAARRRGAKAAAAAPRGAVADRDVAAVQRYLEELRDTEIARQVRTLLHSFVRRCERARMPRLTDMRLVCYGLGTLEYGQNAYHQLALLLWMVECLREATSARVHTYAWDPAFTPRDVRCLAALEASHGVQVLGADADPMGSDDSRSTAPDASPPSSSCLVWYLPHLSAPASSAVLRRAVDARVLDRGCVVGNSFEWVNRTRSEATTAARAEDEGDVSTLVSMCACTHTHVRARAVMATDDACARMEAAPAPDADAVFEVVEVPLSVRGLEEEPYRAHDCTRCVPGRRGIAVARPAKLVTSTYIIIHMV